jgi:DNA-binding NarL/FixJ family response regulator
MIKIAIADDHKLFAQGVANLLEEVGEFEVVGVFTNGMTLVNFLQENAIDLIITDMNMPGMDGMALIQNLKHNKVRSKIIVLSMYDDENIYKQCVKQGIDAYVLKDADHEELILTIQEVMEDRHVMNFQRMMHQIDNDLYDDAYKQKFKLSKREIEVLKQVLQGKTNKEIADCLFLSVFTVETHRKHIHQKLGVSNSIELMKKTQEMNL